MLGPPSYSIGRRERASSDCHLHEGQLTWCARCIRLLHFNSDIPVQSRNLGLSCFGDWHPHVQRPWRGRSPQGKTTAHLAPAAGGITKAWPLNRAPRSQCLVTAALARRFVFQMSP